jgi:hypothetical protein
MQRRLAVAGIVLSGLLVPISQSGGASVVVKPFVSCVSREETTITVVFGYDNPSKRAIAVPAGIRNQVTPSGAAPQVTTFRPGKVVNGFTSRFASYITPTWSLQSSKSAKTLEAKLSASTPKCAASSAALPKTQGLSVSLNGKQTSYRLEVNEQPFSFLEDVLLMASEARQQWTVFLGDNKQKSRLRFGSDEGLANVRSYVVTQCVAKHSSPGCVADGASVALDIDGDPDLDLSAWDLPSLGLKPASMTISRITPLQFQQTDDEGKRIGYALVEGTIVGRLAAVQIPESGAPAITKGPVDVRVNFDVILTAFR